MKTRTAISLSERIQRAKDAVKAAGQSEPQPVRKGRNWRDEYFAVMWRGHKFYITKKDL